MNTQTVERYRATRTFGMGGMSIQPGTVIEFDGYSIAVQGRPPQALPTFVGAIKMGWVAREADYDPRAPQARPQAAGIKVRPADTGNPNNRTASSSLIATAAAEEQVVSDVQSHAASVRQANQSRSYRAAPGTIIEPQDGVPVRTLKTLANSRDGVRTVLEGSSAHDAIAAANRVQIEPGRGITREELLAKMDPKQRALYEAEISARASIHPLGAGQTQAGPETQGRVIATIDAPEAVETMGIRTTTTVGGGTETVDLSGLDSAPAEVSVLETEGLRFTTTNGPRKAVTVKAPLSGARAPIDASDPRRVIARSICADFPDNYDFEAPARRKLARLQADYDDRPDVIRAVAAAETDAELKAILVGEFPEAFQTP